MNTTTISPEWTLEERLVLISELAAKVMTASNGLPNRETVYDLGERIRFIATASPAFLEANRDQIING